MGNSSGGLAKLIGWLTQAQTLLAAIIAVLGLLTQLLPESWRASLTWLHWLGPAVALLAGLWLARSAYRNWTRRPPTFLSDSALDGTVQIRGPRPFEDGEKLLGRDQETNRLFSMVRSLEFRWGYLSGEAGAGKTSLIRAGLTRLIREQQPDWRLVYLPRTGQHPDREIAARLGETLSPPLPAEAALTDVLAAAIAPGQPVTLTIVDQFEEFFLSARTGEIRDAVTAGLRALWEAGRKNGKIRLLFSLRKEFVDDLLSLGAQIEGLRFDQEWRFPLANLAVDVAEQMLDRIAEQGELPLSRQLRPRLAADLAVDGRVRPVELQIVLSRMLEQRVYELPDYAARKGARGIISRFIAETIDAPGREVPEIDRQVGRHLLRALCADNFAARRPVGLSAAELHGRIREQLSTASGGTSFTAEKLRGSLHRVLAEFCRARVVIEEDEDRFNLAHDYLAAPVRDATADIETAEERANRLLQHYVAQSRVEKGTAVPFRSLRQILRYSSREAREGTDARTLIRRSKRRLAVLGAAAAAILLVGGLAATQPSGWQLRPGPMTADRLLLLAPDRDLALILRDGRTQLVRLREPGAPATMLPAGAANGQFSPGGDMLIFPSGRDIYRAERRAGFVPVLLIANAAQSPYFEPSRWLQFSANGEVAILSLGDGRVFAVRPGRPPVLVTVAAAPDLAPLGPRNPRFSLSWSGRYVAVISMGSAIVIHRTDVSRGSGVPILGSSLNSIFMVHTFDFSRDDRHFAWLDNRGAVNIASVRTGRPAQAILRASGSGLEAVFFGPRSDLLLARDVHLRIYAWRIGDPPQDRPAFAAASNMEAVLSPLPRFNDAGDAMLSLSNGQVYIWELSSPGTAGLARLVEARTANSQTGIFCRGPGVALLVGRNGMLHRFHYGGGGGRAEPIQPLFPSPAIARSRTGDGVVIFGQDYVATGECSRGAFRVTRVDAAMTNVFVGSDPRELMVATPSGLLPVRETFLLWGIPLFDRQWPLLGADAR